MNDGQKRRHIRDIAHLYISGCRQDEPALHWRLVIAGENKRFFPGFHAANLAAALAFRGCDVRLHERSGLLPNAGFYFSLPPTRYIRWDPSDGEPEPGLAGVTVDCSMGVVSAARGGSPRTRVDVVHLPPFSDSPPERVYAPPREDEPRSLVALVVAGGESASKCIASGALGRLGADAVLVLRVDAAETPGWDAGAAPEGEAESRGGYRGPAVGEDRQPEIGRVAEWESALADPVPVVVRDPSSAISAAYLSAADSLRFTMDELRRTVVGPSSTQGSPGYRSGRVDREPGSEGTVLPISRFGTRHSRRSSG